MAVKKKIKKKTAKKKVSKKKAEVIERKKSIASAKTSSKVKKIQESIVAEFSDELCKVLDSKPKPINDGISWGLISLNLKCTGNPFVGIVRGRIYEVFGPESSAKTTLVLTAIAECQANGGTAAFVDAEHALDPNYAKRIGVQLENLLLSQPDCGEEALEMTEAFVRRKVDLIAVDSVAALTPRSEIEGNMGDAQMGVQARLMGQAMRKLTAISAKSKSSIIFINQTRHKIGVMFGSPETVCGGNALKFYASFRLRMSQLRSAQKKVLGVNKLHVGSPHIIKVVKNKVYIPFGQTEVKLYFGLGFDRIGDLYGLATEYDLISKGQKGFYNISGVGRVNDLQRYVPEVEELVREHFKKKVEEENA